MTDRERFDEEGLTPEQREKIERLLDELMAAISGDPGDGADDGASVHLRLVPHEPESDDPRGIVAIEAEGKAAEEREPAEPERDQDEVRVEFGPNMISPDAVERIITEKVNAAVGPLLDAQKAAAEKRREETGRRSGTPEEQVQARRDFQDGVRGLREFVCGMENYCRERVLAGCRWWENELPQPLKAWLTGVAVVGGGAAFAAAPMSTGVITVAVVALVTRRRRPMERDKDADRQGATSG